MVVTRTMKALYDVCEAYEKGTVTQQEFLAALKANEARVRHAEATLAALTLPDIPEDATDAERDRAQEFLIFGGDALGLLAQGTGHCMAGLMTLENYAREDQVADMRDGLKQYFEGCQKLLQIERVGRSFVAALPPRPEGTDESGRLASDEAPLQDGDTI